MKQINLLISRQRANFVQQNGIFCLKRTEIYLTSIEETYALLRQKVEKTIGRKMLTPKDFDYLVMNISFTLKMHMSPTTLKRFWGYIDKDKDAKPRISTLNILALLVGYSDFEHFCSQSTASVGNNSDFICNKTISTAQLSPDDQIRLMWKPDRCVTVRYMGTDTFEVIESINSKLEAGDIFHRNYIIENEPLYIYNLISKGRAYAGYMCGKDGGVKFTLTRSAFRGG